MRIDKRESLSGLVTIAFGLLVVIESTSYNIGNLLRMGPGYFPLMLGVAITFIGIIILIKSAFVQTTMDKIQWRPLIFIMIGLVCFGLAINSLGIIVATTALVVASRLSEKALSWRNTFILALCLNVMVYVVFIYGLSIPLKLFPWS
ncbi:tripartite tricarboxylate transporter TctB family protein [Nitrincola sp.]|uniref:tripartite tricarboxylate transporter TctB family protein n=1 Tax=Nitrincola sp. TaxID=1926584 RepID=UPI003A956458